MRPAARLQARAGFTLVEILVVLVVIGIVTAALQRANVQQRRLALWSSSEVLGHDAVRVAGSLLGMELREAVASAGDLVLHADDSLSVRAPQGFGVACSVRTQPASVGVSRVTGLAWQGGADSLLLFTTSGWAALHPARQLANPGPQLDCLNPVGAPQTAYDLANGSTDDVPVGAPVRFFRRHTYHLGDNDGEPWLARTDAQGTEMLVGPLAADGLRFRLLDADGLVTNVSAAARGIELRLIVRATPVPGGPEATADTFAVVLWSRNP